MSYYFRKVLPLAFDDAVNKVTEALKQQGFGILTKIDVQATMKKKLDVERITRDVNFSWRFGCSASFS